MKRNLIGLFAAIIAVGATATLLIIRLKNYEPNPTVTPPSPTNPVPRLGAPIIKDISADLDWQNTEFFVQAGSTLIIEQVSGRWNECAPYGCPYKDANGNPDSLPNQDNNFMLGCLHASLIARVSTSWFCVGTSYEGQIQESGYLELRINDNQIEDNEGTITVRITLK